MLIFSIILFLAADVWALYAVGFAGYPPVIAVTVSALLLCFCCVRFTVRVMSRPKVPVFRSKGAVLKFVKKNKGWWLVEMGTNGSSSSVFFLFDSFIKFKIVRAVIMFSSRDLPEWVCGTALEVVKRLAERYFILTEDDRRA